MSEVTRMPVPLSRDRRPPAVPVQSPAGRHEPPAGLAAFDWRWRHAFAVRRERRLRDALADAAGLAGVPGDIPLDALRAAAAQLAGVPLEAGDFRDVVSLLRGCYVVEAGATRRQALVAAAAAVAASCGLRVHVGCAEAEAAAAMADAVRARLPEALRARASADPEALLSDAVVVCGALNAFAHAWLRLGGNRSPAMQAAAALGGTDRGAFPFASVLLSAEGDTLLLDLQRHPLQVTGDAPDDNARLALEALALVASWRPGVEYEGGAPTVAGQALVDAAVKAHGGAWAVPRERDATLRAVIAARALEDGRDYRCQGGRVQWLPGGATVEQAMQERVELVLRCRHDPSGMRRVLRRAWFLDFLSGYPLVGAAGDNLADEWRDLWLMHAMPVLGATPRPLDVQWREERLAGLVPAAPDGVLVAAASPRLVSAEAGLPPGTPHLESSEGRAAVRAAIAEGRQVWLVGAPGAVRHVPEGVSAIMLCPDDPAVARPVIELARRASRLGAAGRWLGRQLGRWVLWRAAGQRYRMRCQLLQRRLQERRTYAFTGSSQDSR